MPGHAPRKPRYMVSRKVRVQSGSATADGMVVDLHEWGARLEAPVPFAVGETVSFTL
ncbi:MAG: PilZ domain-containing protein [Roseicyclus sp.]